MSPGEEKERVTLVSEDAGLRIKRGFVNFVAIFLGVSLSFLAEDWREDLREVEDGLRSLQGIVADINQDVPTARGLARSDSVAIQWGLWLHGNWERTDLPPDSVDRALQALHSGGPYTPVRSEYESAKYAGRLQYIENQGLRGDITGLYESSQPLLVTCTTSEPTSRWSCGGCSGPTSPTPRRSTAEARYPPCTWRRTGPS
ncbi:MAG: hypothetical protein ACOC8K_02270 [Gemmatimonadota bacterium]